jgi:DNA-binding CsgD family transcriptional regulator
LENIDHIKNEFIKWWTDHDVNQFQKKDLPDFLKANLLTNILASNHRTVVQIYDMAKFRCIYASPNCVDICGYTSDELLSHGLIHFFTSLPIRESLFYIKSGQFVNEKVNALESKNQYFSNHIFNISYKNKNKERRKMISSNICIEWTPEGKQSYQLIMWQDMTHIFKSDEFYVRYQFGKDDPSVWTYESIKKQFTKGEMISPREIDVLHTIHKGLSSKEAADMLQLSSFTIDNHKKNMMNRLQVKNTSDLLDLCVWMGVV